MYESPRVSPSRSGGNRSKYPASGGIPSVSHHKVRTLYGPSCHNRHSGRAEAHEHENRRSWALYGFNHIYCEAGHQDTSLDADVLQARSERGTDRGFFKLHRNGDAAHESALFLSYGDRLVSQVRSSAPFHHHRPPSFEHRVAISLTCAACDSGGDSRPADMYINTMSVGRPTTRRSRCTCRLGRAST